MTKKEMKKISQLDWAVKMLIKRLKNKGFN